MKPVSFDQGSIQSRVTVENKYDFKVAVKDAHQYSHFQIDASELNNDVHIALSEFSGHSDPKWEIVIGGWSGGMSALCRKTPDGSVDILHKPHSKEVFDAMKSSIEVIVTDGKLTVKGNGEVFFEHEDSSIRKDELKYMLLSGGWGGHGTYKIYSFPAGKSRSYNFSSISLFSYHYQCDRSR